MNCPYVMRMCSKCGEVKFLFKFVKHKGRKYGFENGCKECRLAYDKQYREERKEEISEYKKQYYENNKKEILEQCKQYYEERKEEIAEYKKQYYKEHKKELAEKKKQYYENNKKEILEKNKQYYENNKEEKLEYHKKYREEHKEERAEYHKRYYKEHKEGLVGYRKQYRKEHKKELAEKNKQYYKDNKEEILKKNKQYYRTSQGQVARFNGHNKRRIKEKIQGSGITKTQWLEMMNFFEWKCAYSDMYIGGNENQRNRSIDHIIALDNGGENEIWNLVPMYKSYNSSKQTKDMLEWYQQQDFYSEERLQKIYEWQEYAYNKWNVNI